jgi:hypothetical protein
MDDSRCKRCAVAGGKVKAGFASSLLPTAQHVSIPHVARSDCFDDAAMQLPLCCSKTKHTFTADHPLCQEPRAKHGSAACTSVSRSLATPQRNDGDRPSFMRTHVDPIRPLVRYQGPAYAVTAGGQGRLSLGHIHRERSNAVSRGA